MGALDERGEIVRSPCRDLSVLLLAHVFVNTDLELFHFGSLWLIKWRISRSL